MKKQMAVFCWNTYGGYLFRCIMLVGPHYPKKIRPTDTKIRYLQPTLKFD